jgi:deoxyribonuclease-4
MIIGHTMSTEHGIVSAIRLIHMRGGNALQITTGPLNEMVINQWPSDETETILKMREQYGIYIVVHGKYLYNFAHTVVSAKWQRDLLIRELQIADSINADVVIHQGKNVNKDPNALKNFVDNVTMVIKNTITKNSIILENSAHQGSEMGYTLDELITIYNMFDLDTQKRIGICWDLCHAFVAGQDLRKPEIALNHMDKMIRSFGSDTHFLIHFNDSSAIFDAKNDSHAPLCCGFIGDKTKGGSVEGFKVISQFCLKHNIPIIMETGHGNIKGEIDMIKQWTACPPHPH